MFIDNKKPRKRGRPPGQTAQGAAAKQRLYGIAIARMARHGYDTTTLRDIADEAGVSVGLLYRYFPNKRAVIVALYEELSADYVRRASAMNPGKWRDRFIFALRASLEVLEPHRRTLQGLIPVLVGDPEEGLFGQRAAFSRRRFQRVFEEAVLGATDAPASRLAEAVGRLLYLVHLAVLMWWLLDRTPKQRATAALVLLFQQVLPSAALTLRLPSIRRFVVSLDGLVREGLFGDGGRALGSPVGGGA
jgi:AcrR family transcriptional regulator